MRILHSRSLVCAVVLLTLGCPGDDVGADDVDITSALETGLTTTESPTSTTNEPVTSSTTEVATTAETTTDDTTATTMTTAMDDTTATGADTETTGPIGGACGDAECDASQWCDFSDGVCGAEGVGGQAGCEARPNGCPDVYQPVCGCDGQVHGNECDANAAGVDVDAEGDCETPEGYFRCGYRYCSPEFEYCQIQYSDIGGFGHSYNCVSPMDCDGPPTCDCLSGEFCFDSGCEPTPDGGGVQIGCPGG